MRISAYLRIARPDYWTNNVFILPGIALAFLYAPHLPWPAVGFGIVGGIVGACLVASSNYVLNEILDADKDRHHPEKRHRPIPAGQVSVPVAYALWTALAVLGIGLGFLCHAKLGFMLAVFWIAGTLYNVPPVRLKDLSYVDVLSESVNNPIRMAIGWYSTGHGEVPPLSALLAYWMFGAFLMTMKRFAEFRHLGDPALAARYRQSFGRYSEERLIECVCFYAAMFGMLSGFFMARYRIELILATPLVAYAMAYYMHLGFKPDSPVQHPERLYRSRKLMLLVSVAFLACAALLFVEIPWLNAVFRPSEIPVSHGIRP